MTEVLQITTTSGTHDFHVEIASDDASRARGLMDRRSMPSDHGMLFVFDGEAHRIFRMTRTYIPLDVIFLSATGLVNHIVANAAPLSERDIPGPCSAVLELNGGTAARIRLKIGDQARLKGSEMENPATKTDPRLLQEAKNSPTLKYMIEHGLPLTREQWISMNYMGHPPEPWTDEHEADVPTPFQLHPQDEG